MGRRSKRKGDRIEHETVTRFRRFGLTARRVPLSGAAGGEFSGDIRVDVAGEQLTCEVKARAGAAGFKQVLGWLGTNDLLVLRADKLPPVVVLPFARFAALAAAAGCPGQQGDEGE